MKDDGPRRNPSRCLSEHTLSEMVCDDEPRRNPSRCLSETTLSEMVSDGPQSPQGVISPDSNPGLSASVAMRAATVLRDAFHPDLDKCRGAIHRYVRRVAVPAIARHVLYKYDERVIHHQRIDHEYDCVTTWSGRTEHRRSDSEILALKPSDFSEFQAALGLSVRTVPDDDDDEGWAEFWDEFWDVIEKDDVWLAFCLRGKSQCKGFAGYEKPSDETDLEFLAALPDRVLAALSEKPPQITLDFCALLRSAHGQSAVDDIEFTEYNDEEDADARLPSMSLNFVNTQGRAFQGSCAVACFTATVAYVPSFEQARPVPVQFCPYNFNHDEYGSAKMRSITAREVCAMGPTGASCHRLKKKPTK